LAGTFGGFENRFQGEERESCRVFSDRSGGECCTTSFQ
jgi:hypothetical protein